MEEPGVPGTEAPLHTWAGRRAAWGWPGRPQSSLPSVRLLPGAPCGPKAGSYGNTQSELTRALLVARVRATVKDGENAVWPRAQVPSGCRWRRVVTACVGGGAFRETASGLRPALMPGFLGVPVCPRPPGVLSLLTDHFVPEPHTRFSEVFVL